MGKAMFTIIGAMAELERNVIRERIVAGLEHAKQHGTKSGAEIGRPRAIFDRTRWRSYAQPVVAGVRLPRSYRSVSEALAASMHKVWRNLPRGRPESVAQ
jgi:DNA invertase Pin-like site-specific DNA recombinase